MTQQLPEPNVVGVAALSERPSTSGDVYADAENLGKLIREACIQAGVGTAEPRNPMSALISPGMTVMIKPNWVDHRNHGGAGLTCMVTHHEFVRAALVEVLKNDPARVIIADAPVQSCDWDQLVDTEFRRSLVDLGNAAGCAVEIHDLRRCVSTQGKAMRTAETNLRPLDEYTRFDLGGDSLLEPLSDPPGRFRVACYDDARLAEVHRPGVHQYLLTRFALEADVILSMPKLKLHKKAGLTGALKNLVGMNGDKDFLPHHRVGGTLDGGDCYPGRSFLRSRAEFFQDQANKNIGRGAYRFWRFLYRGAWALCSREGEPSLDGSWYGNDTCWRMTLDLNRVLLYGRVDGTMADSPQRRIYSLTDALVCGEGNSPLAPEPLAVGAVTFASSSVAAEIAHAALLRVDPQKLALIREASGSFRWPLLRGDVAIRYADAEVTPEDLARSLGADSRAPEGWRGHIEWRL